MTSIELIGCTSAGKSTFAKHILQVCRDKGIDASLGEDFLLDQFHFGQVGNYTARAALVNLISLPIALANWGKYRRFYSFAFRTIAHLQIAQREKIYLGRNILKSIGIYETVQMAANDGQIILLDEGPLHSANILFVNIAATPPGVELSEFALVVPLPDSALYLRERDDVLIQRTLVRGHKRIQKGNHNEAERFVQSAIAMFERLIQEPLVQSKLFIVDNHQVIPSQGNSNDPLQKFVLIIIQDCLNNPNVDVDSDIHMKLETHQSFQLEKDNS